MFSKSAVAGASSGFFIALSCALPTKAAANAQENRAEAQPQLAARALAEQELLAARALPDGAKRWLAESRALFHVARETKKDDESDPLLAQGADLAEKALCDSKFQALALELWIANAGLRASHHRTFASLRVVDRLEKRLLELKKIDADFDQAAADRGLAGLYLNAPGWISVGSNRKARAHARLALDKFPNSAPNKLAYAEILVYDGNRTEAVKLASSALLALDETKPKAAPAISPESGAEATTDAIEKNAHALDEENLRAQAKRILGERSTL